MTSKGKEKVVAKSVETPMRDSSCSIELDSLPPVNTLDIWTREYRIQTLNLMLMLWDWRILIPNVMKELRGEDTFVGDLSFKLRG
ncbi:hypothetical protein R1flu_009157 [Riccia fluitans]|uniref:Uncharacterized protein n=1 Tax=Riccia fluitans TaxID=41844 RepID=A0ABD1Z243_9MARC